MSGPRSKERYACYEETYPFATSKTRFAVLSLFFNSSANRTEICIVVHRQSEEKEAHQSESGIKQR